MNSAPQKVDKQIVLIGAGNAHLVFLRKWRMKPVPGVSVLLINESATMPYSAMVPGYLAHEYRREEIEVDLPRFCQSAGVRFLPSQVSLLNVHQRSLRIAGRPYELSYDLLSLNLGADAVDAEFPSHFSLRPMARFLDRISALDELMTTGKHPKNLIVLGAGPSGCELAVALSRRYAAQKPGIHVFEKRSELLPQFSAGAGRWFLDRFSERGIYFHSGTEPIVSATHVTWDDKKIEADAVMLAVTPRAPRLLKNCGLSLNDKGYVIVGASLQSVSHEDVFAAGDCSHFSPRPTIAKNGVYSVRMGEALFANLASRLQGYTLKPFRPQWRYLALFNGGSGQGLLARHRLSLAGRWTRRLKDRIDRGWMRSFETMPLPNDSIRCAGCAAKVPAAVLHPSLEKTGVVTGSDAAEDCAILDAGDDSVTLSTVDFVPAFLDDPYLVGKITALHCLSDLYAMNGTPETALVTLMLPWANGRLQKEWFEEVMAGVREITAAHHTRILGGHTGEGDKICVGLAVTGRGMRHQLFLKRNLEEGDRLVLTKRLGTGIILAGHMQRLAKAPELQGAVAEMLVSNSTAAKVLAEAGVKAATDVTGFGLAGHLSDLLRASSKSAELSVEKLPLLEGCLRLSDLGVRSSLHPENAASFCSGARTHPALYDPQTSGGLLAGIPPKVWDEFTERAKNANVAYWEIGRVTAQMSTAISLE